MLLEVVILFSCLLVNTDPPPLTEIDLLRLGTTMDERDTLGEGFAVLEEHVHLWEPTVVAQAKPEMMLMRTNPSAYRGELFVVSGVIEQQEQLSSPWEASQEWFIRDADGNLFVLYVIGETSIATQTRIQAPARFYKTISITARDKRLRMYPTFVTTAVVINTTNTGSVFPMPVLLLPVVVGASVVVFLLGRFKKQSLTRERVPRIHTEEVLHAVNESNGSLPEDPAQALASMYEQSEDEL